MRLRILMTPLALGLMAGAILVRRWRRRARHAGLTAAEQAGDPLDPVQSLHEVAELVAMPLDLDVQAVSDIEAAQDLAGLDGFQVGDEADGDDAIELDRSVRERDAGDLYGVHTPRAVDRDLPDDDRAFVDGQNWIEALETSAIEMGPEPERELAIVDDEDILQPPHPSDARDRPVADLGSGGRRGL